MAVRSTAEEMENLRLSDSDTDDLQGSPPGQHGKAFNQKVSDKDKSTSGSSRPHDSETLFDREEAREAALRDELRAIQKINEVIEGLLDSLDRAKGNMQTVSRTVDSASTLLNTWTRILSQTEHNQRLILDRNWQGASQDVIDMEHEEVLRKQEAERRERELQQQREAAARKAEEAERKRAQATGTTSKGRLGTTRGRVRTTGLGKTSGVSHSSTSTSTTRTATRGSTTSTTTRRPVSGSGIARGTGIARGRGRV